MKFILPFLLLPSLASAATTIQTEMDAKQIFESLRGKTSSARMECDGDLCTIDYVLKDGAVFSLKDKRATIISLTAELALLENKIDDGTITNAELRRLIKIVLKLTRLSKDP